MFCEEVIKSVFCQKKTKKELTYSKSKTYKKFIELLQNDM